MSTHENFLNFFQQFNLWCLEHGTWYHCKKSKLLHCALTQCSALTQSNRKSSVFLHWLSISERGYHIQVKILLILRQSWSYLFLLTPLIQGEGGGDYLSFDSIYTATAIPFIYSFSGNCAPQPQFPHACVCERFIYSLDRSTYFLQQKRQTHRTNI